MKSLITIVFLFAVITANAQNIQLHFDPRHALKPNEFEKNYLSLTFETENTDKWGSTYGYIDVNFNQSRGNIGLAYLELARDQKIANLPVMVHIEYNGGVGKMEVFGLSIPNSYLAGASFNHNFGNVNISTYLAYKYNAFEKVSNDVQWTVKWNADLFNNKLTLSGFLDIWSENRNRLRHSKKEIILLTEPQIWYNITNNLSIGSEIKITNFHKGKYKYYVHPTVGLKWNF